MLKFANRYRAETEAAIEAYIQSANQDYIPFLEKAVALEHLIIDVLHNTFPMTIPRCLNLIDQVDELLRDQSLEAFQRSALEKVQAILRETCVNLLDPIND
uniref:Uncharacterized protein n=2 Tax=Spongospora subterranea TaxID=70186 RepID=A0A0H5QJF3_9EUKA|eukprot:CRZ02128.1 hypothetical protein [Spongospora subterranea]